MSRRGDLPDLSDLAEPGRVIALRARPGAARDRLTVEGGVIRVHVTAAAEKGRANAAILKLLAKALGVPKSRLTLVQGASGRDKAVRVE